MTNTILGKIHEVHFGFSDGRFGLFLTLGNSANMMQDSLLTQWDPTNEITKHHKYTKEDVDKLSANMVLTIATYLKDAKITSIEQLKGIPVEITFKDNMLESWRILTEVL